MNTKDYVIRDNETVLDALKKIDEHSSYGTRILFVEDKDGKVCGSISDGDCRRGLINGKNITSSVSEIMNKKFTYIQKGIYDTEKIQKIRTLGLKYVPELNEDGSLYKIHDFN